VELSLEQALAKGISAKKCGNRHEAETIFRAILKSNPTHAETNYHLGTIALLEKKPNLALPFLKAAYGAKPKTTKYCLSYIEALLDNNLHNTAAEVLERAEENSHNKNRLRALRKRLNPTDSDQDRLNALLERFKAGALAEAELLAKTITEDNPNLAMAWKILGAIYTKFGKHKESLVIQKRIIELEPMDAKAHNALGNTLKALGHLKNAEESYTTAVTLDSRYAGAYYNLGNTLRVLGDSKAAVKNYKIALKLNPGLSEALFQLAITFKEIGEYNDAMQCYRQLISIHPDNVAAFNNLGNILELLGQLPEAIQCFKTVIRLNNEAPEGYSNAANALRQQGRFDEAEWNCRKAIELQPTYAEAHNNLALVLQKQGRLSEAKFALEKCLTLKPEYSQAYSNLANLLIESGKPSDAIKYCETAIGLDDTSAGAHSALGAALQELGRIEEAEASYTKSIQLSQDEVKNYTNLGILMIQKNEIEIALELLEKSCDFKRGALTAKRVDNPRPLIMSKAKVLHDIEQFEYLASLSILQPRMLELVNGYKNVEKEISWPSLTAPIPIPQAYSFLLANSGKLIYKRLTKKLDFALNESLDVQKITDAYRRHKFGLTYVDNFLSSEALINLRAFLMESTIWFESKGGGYLGAYLGEGLACTVILQIAQELKSKFPGIIQHHALREVWAYKYDNNASFNAADVRGIRVHADAAAVNVNFWVTTNDANLDAESGGLIVYDAEAPLEWGFRTYNNDENQIRKEIEKQDCGKTKIPYRENRMVIFNSNLFHETDQYSFKSGYENRRINVTMLFGRRQ